MQSVQCMDRVVRPYVHTRANDDKSIVFEQSLLQHELYMRDPAQDISELLLVSKLYTFLYPDQSIS